MHWLALIWAFVFSMLQTSGPAPNVTRLPQRPAVKQSTSPSLPPTSDATTVIDPWG